MSSTFQSFIGTTSALMLRAEYGSNPASSAWGIIQVNRSCASVQRLATSSDTLIFLSIMRFCAMGILIRK
jgi:hypothetical protein